MSTVLANPAEMIAHGAPRVIHNDAELEAYTNALFQLTALENGAGLGASHQSSWTGVVAKLIELFGRLDGTQLLEAGKAGAFAKTEPVLDKRVA